VTTVGRIIDTPLVVKGRTWFPATQLITWSIMAWVTEKRYPERWLFDIRAFQKRCWLVGGVCLGIVAAALNFALGILKEQE
jgi:hypothetical protein